MQRTVKATPEELFADATAFMVNNGASVGSQAGSSITFVARQAPDRLTQGVILATGAFNLTAGMTALTAFGVNSENSATLVAVRKGNQTTITIPDLETLPANLLRFWFTANVLRESLPHPIHKLQTGYHRVLIWNDRIEDFRRIFFWIRRDTIMMDDVASVVATKRVLYVQADDDREIVIDVPAWEAEAAKQIIDGRVEVHRSPSLV